MTTDTTYNGHKNHATWNVSLWIGNDQGIQSFACESADYASFRDAMREVGYLETPDRVAYNDSSLDIAALDDMIYELHVNQELLQIPLR
jgi:hypothetical protein